MKKEFVPYEQSLDLHLAGFNEPCLCYYSVKDNIDAELKNVDNDLINFRPVNYPSIKAPLYQQVFRWFREKHKLHSSIDFQRLKERIDDDDIELYEWKINEQWTEGKDWIDFKYGFKHHSRGVNHKSHEDAELACVNKLIEIIKNN